MQNYTNKREEQKKTIYLDQNFVDTFESLHTRKKANEPCLTDGYESATLLTSCMDVEEQDVIVLCNVFCHQKSI